MRLRRFGHHHRGHRDWRDRIGVARQLASGGETLRLSSADKESAPTLATEIGRAVVVAVDNFEQLIRTAGFEQVKVGGIEQSGRLEVGGDLYDLVVGPTKAPSLVGGA